MQFQDVSELYRQLHEANPGVVQGMGHRTKQTATMQYDQVDEEIREQGVSVLDVGCGYGHLYHHLYDPVWPILYTGIDTHPAAIETAKRLAGELARDGGQPNPQFVVADIRQEGKIDHTIPTWDKDADIVAVVGTLAWYDPDTGLEIAMRAWELTKQTLVIVLHQDTNPLNAQDIIDHLHPKYYMIDHSWDEFVTGLHVYKEER